MKDGEGQPLTHLDERGAARMVDVGGKERTDRRAVARARLHMRPATLAAIRQGALKKGDALAVARVAAIQAAKETWRLIPLCHPITLDGVTVDFALLEDGGAPDLAPECTAAVEITVAVAATDRTGAEMEALTAAAVAGLTLYDMAKAADRGMVLGEVRLDEKSGGKSGHYLR